MKFSICAEMLFTGLPFHERVDRIREAGFSAVEFWAWKDKDLDQLQHRVDGGMKIATFSGHRKRSLVEPADLSAYADEVRESMATARRLGCGGLMLLTDELSSDGSVKTAYRLMTHQQKRENVIAGLKALAPLAEEQGVDLYLEPLNTVVDHKGYWLESSAEGFAIVDAVGSARVRLLFDIYHMQIMEGNIIASLSADLDKVGHIHVADVPGRHEPGTGELNYANILSPLAAQGYEGYVGFEFSPAGDDARALEAIAALGTDLF